jgi:peptide/nickel transport system permease protein
MTARVARRLLLAVPLTLAVSFLAFLLQRVAGGSYFDQFKTDRRFDPAQIRELERRAHLDQPLLLQYLHWLRGVCFDVRIGRPRHELEGFESSVDAARPWTLSPGGDAQRSGDETCAGIRALRVRAGPGGAELSIPLPGRWEARPGERADFGGSAGDDIGLEVAVFARDGGTVAARAGDGAAVTTRVEPRRWIRIELPRAAERLTLEFRDGGEWYVDSIAAVARRWTVSCGAPDFGRSFKYDTPVFALLLPAVGNSLLLAIAALALTFGLAIPLGAWSALRRDGPVDRLLSGAAFLATSVPGFFLALVVLYAVVEWVNGPAGRTLLPIGADRSPGAEGLSLLAQLADRAWHLLLPAFVLAAGSVAAVQRSLRGELLDQMRAPYVAAARAKGLGERELLVRHALRNALHPLVTLFGLRLAELLSGAALVEIVFQYPGMGRLVLEATIGRDLHVVMAAIVMGALILVVVNLLVDAALAWLDPRVDLAAAAGAAR